MKNETQSGARRLLSLDVLRGLTVAGMILVNNGYGESFQMLRHSQWNGMTPCDLVFPFFLFIMGVSCYVSMSRRGFQSSPAMLRKVVRRTLLLFAIGLFINWFELAMKGTPLDLQHLRLWAVLQRIALCYLAVSLFALYVPHRYTLHTAAALLVAYTIIIICGNGYAEDASANILAQADRALFGYDHLYHKSPVDPEGLLGTISSVAHVLLGFYCGRLVTGGKRKEESGERKVESGERKVESGERKVESGERKVESVFCFATVCVFLGYLLTYGLPLNKRIWSPSYVLVTCGLCALLLALLYSEERRVKSEEFATALPHNANTAAAANSSLFTLHSSLNKAAANSSLFTLHSSLFRVFGTNALALYVASELLAILFGHLGISDAIYGVLHAAIPWAKWASLAYALTFVAINYAIGYVLWKRKIFIKL